MEHITIIYFTRKSWWQSAEHDNGKAQQLSLRRWGVPLLQAIPNIEADDESEDESESESEADEYSPQATFESDVIEELQRALFKP